ncbi:uncharacterized protein LOC111344892 [Stylophora pistillata]|uniref:uncharacterized protein LOC111344892 n=1 Tax=Stylophora pistillata TaxID=50429 RepID=UPI000C043B53|nr:uncharacterized protein LOC111344892 [Stylophora pistillata]XP_022807896.1 uncharacterized protein LOC111344892 [Stylophora pistillata]
MSDQGEVFRDDTLPVVVNFSLNELQDNHDGVYSWRAPSGMTESYFVDFLTEVVNEIVFTEVSKKETGRFLDLLFPTPALLPMLQKLNQTRIKLFKRNDEDTTSILRESLAGFECIIVPYPSHGNIVSVELEMNNETDPTGEMRRKINQILRSEAISYGDSDEEDEKEESQDIYLGEMYSSDEDEEVEREVQASPDKPCYLPSQIEMAAILKERIEAIMSHYHNISRLKEFFNDIDFVVYTARYRMLSDQTEKSICHPDAGVLSKEELELRKCDREGKKRMFMYVRSAERDTHFEVLKRDVQDKPQTLFVIVADECHWGITKDKERKPSAHNLFINEWCKENQHQNVIVLQISATPYNLLTQNSRLPLVPCVILKDDVSPTKRAGDLVVLKQEVDMEQFGKSSKKLELHVVHWSEVELKNFERGMRMKLKSALYIDSSPYKYLQVSTEGNLVATSIPDEATEFIIQGSHGMVTIKAGRAGRLLTVTTDTHGNLEAKSDPPTPTEFEVKMDFGVGIVAFRSCEGQDRYISVDQNNQVSLQAAKIERKCGVSIMKPIHDLAKVSFQFYADQSAPMEVKTVGKQYISLNYYLSTIDSPNKKDQKIREDETFQNIVDKAKRVRRMSQSDSTSFPIDALLCADYCYHIILSSVFNSGDKICKALTLEVNESPTTEFHSRLAVYKMNLKAADVERYIHPEAFELIQRNICDRVTQQFKEDLRNVEKLQKQRASDFTELQTSKEQLAFSIVECIMHLPPQEFEQLKHDTPLFEDIKQQLQANGCEVMVQIWRGLVQEQETSSLVEDLIQSGKGDLGKMKIVRAKTMKTADQFYYTVRLAREVSGLKEHFEVIRDYGGIQIENQLMKSSSPFFKKLQPKICTYKFDCRCSELELQPRYKTCSNCHHVHKSITQYEDLENLACILILVDKGRMGDTFPQSFDCLDLRLSYDSSQEFKEGSAVYLSSLIQELGRMCRYANVSSSVIPYVLIGRQLFKRLQMSLTTSPSMSATSCSKADRYMTKTRTIKDAQSSALRWLNYEAHKDSYDYGNVQTHCNRILLQAEPQIGKTGTYLCLLRELRLDILGKENVFLASPSAFDEGSFYQWKERDNPDESVIGNMDEGEDWQFPYWKTIETSPSLCGKPVGTGKYSIAGCFYAHDVEEDPFTLLKGNERKLIKTGHQNLKTDDCSNGLRAWHWYHFEKCAECGRLLQGRESILENVEVNIDGIPVTVTCSLPSNCPSFTQLKEKSSSGESLEDSLTLAYWIFHPSHRDDPRKCTLNYHHVMQENGRVANYVQVVVVRKEKFEDYRSTWGKVLVILQLPNELPSCDLGPEEGGIGYARLFIQKIAFSLRLEYIFMIDDNVAMMLEAEFTIDDMSGKERKVLRDDNGVMKMACCTFLRPLTSLQKIARGKEIPPMADEKYEPHPLKDVFEAQGFPLYTYSGPAKLFRDKQHGSYGILGLMRSIPKAVSPFVKTQVYAAFLLNVRSTVEKGVFYRPWPCWEDLRFNDDCDKVGLFVIKCNRYSFFKVQYKDWVENLVLPQVFPWDEKCSIVERPVESELPEALEQKIIVEHLSSFVNTSGSDKCFKERVEYDRLVDKEAENSPLRILEQLDLSVVTEEDFTKGVSFLVLSYFPENRRRDTLDVLDSNFCRTKKKIVFVASVKEADKRWPQMTVQTISTRYGICHNDEMTERKAQFAIFSAADPKRHRLRWILIEASFSHIDHKFEIEVDTSDIQAFENKLENSRNALTLEESTSSNQQNARITTKGAKRSHQEYSNDCQTIKRQKIAEECPRQRENQEDETMSADEIVVRKEGESRSKSPYLVREEDGSALFDGEGTAEVENVSDTSIMISETTQVQGSTQDDRCNYRKCFEGTNDVTKAIVDLWMEYKKIPGSTQKLKQESGTSDLTMDYVKSKLAQFTLSQLEERDESGYNALLKACSLPSMSTHLMQYLINDAKVDINSQLPPTFGRLHPTSEELIPGMSALSVAIRCGRKVKTVQTFKSRGKEISLETSDEEGNTALHHCVLSCSKVAFRKLFPLYRSKKWKKMVNGEGKSPLDIAKKMKSSGLSKVKQQSISFMLKEMKSKKNSADQLKRVQKKLSLNDGSLEGKPANNNQDDRVKALNEEQQWSTQIKRQKIGDSYGQHADQIPTISSGKAADGGVALDDDSNHSNVSVKHDTSEKKAKSVQSLDVAAHLDGTNRITGIIVDLWREYKEIQAQVEKKGRSDLTMEEIENKLTCFTNDYLEAADERGYNALLKACSLPYMSPHVMQYLITTRKVDLNCQLPSDFDVTHPTAKGLVPRMSSLSVAIRKGNVKSVSTFMNRSTWIKVRSVDDNGNTALHHCVISIYKTAFDKIFPLFKPLEWQEMRNKAGKNPLDICIEKEEELGRQKRVKKKALEKVRDMRKEMEEVSA